MKPSLLGRLQRMQARLEEVNAALASEDTARDRRNKLAGRALLIGLFLLLLLYIVPSYLR